ncbi:MAG: hypothetical protein IJE27_02695, partial [Anaerotignum sp.]|nr:hypothetical protein [Anaerotignum sp.]
MKMKKKRTRVLLLLVLLLFSVVGCGKINSVAEVLGQITEGIVYSEPSFDLATLPAYEGKAYVVLNQNIPDFSEKDLAKSVFEEYSPLDLLGRCGP